MGKSTSVKSKSKGSDSLTKVKNASVTKPADSPKATSKKAAKEMASKGVKDDKKKKSKKPEPESESESSEDSEEDSEDSSDESSEDEKPTKKAAAATSSAKKAAVTKKAASDSDSDSDDSDSSSEEEEKPKAKAAKTNGAAKKESSDSDSDSSEEEEKPVTKANGAAKKEESSDSDSDSSDSDEEEEGAAKAKASSDSDSDSSDSDEEEEEKPKEAEEPVKKRKALDDPVIPSKKARTENASEESATLFVGSLAWAVNDDILYQAYSEFPDLVSARVITDREGGRSRGFGYVDFSNRDAAAKALEATQGQELEGRAMNVDFSDARPARSDNPRERADNRAQKHGDAVSPESDTLFVGNLSFDIDQESVREFFASAAEVTGVRLPTDPESGSLKGFGYVTFSSVEEAKSAFGQLNGQYLGEGRASRAVRLDYAGARPPRDGGGRGGFGGGRGGGRGGPRGGGGRGGPGGRGGRGGGRGGFSSTNRGGLGDFSGNKITF